MSNLHQIVFRVTMCAVKQFFSSFQSFGGTWEYIGGDGSRHKIWHSVPPGSHATMLCVIGVEVYLVLTGIYGEIKCSASRLATAFCRISGQLRERSEIAWVGCSSCIEQRSQLPTSFRMAQQARLRRLRKPNCSLDRPRWMGRSWPLERKCTTYPYCLCQNTERCRGVATLLCALRCFTATSLRLGC